MTIVALEHVSTPGPRHRMRRLLVDLLGYGLASAAALACDAGLLVALTYAGLDYRVAAGIGFVVGMGVAYALSARCVFADRRAASRQQEIAGFVAVGLGGLVLTQLILVALVSGLGCPVSLAKVPTAGVVFLFNFLCRRNFVFARPAA